MGFIAVCVALALVACGAVIGEQEHILKSGSSRSLNAHNPSIYDILSGDVNSFEKPVQRVNVVISNPDYRLDSYQSENAPLHEYPIENNINRSDNKGELSLDELTDDYKRAVKEHILQLIRQSQRQKTDEQNESNLNIDNSDHSAIKNAVEAAILARQSNEELAKAVHAANMAHSAPHAKMALRNAAVTSAFNSAKLAQQSNAKLAAAVRSYSLNSRSGGTAHTVEDKATLEAAVDETRIAKKENAELVRALDSSQIARENDAGSGVIANAAQAAKHAHESNAEIGAAIHALESARLVSGSDEEKNGVAVAAAVNAARLSQQSKEELAAAVSGARRRGNVDSEVLQISDKDYSKILDQLR